MTTLPELSRRVSEAEGPSRELDVAIGHLLDLKLEGGAFRIFRSVFEDDAECAVCCDEHHNYWTKALPRYTYSLDAVCALIAEKLPGWSWSAGVDHEAFMMPGELPCSGAVMGNVREWQPAHDEPPEIAYDHHERKAKTPALALLSAALLAIHESNKSDDKA